MSDNQEKTLTPPTEEVPKIRNVSRSTHVRRLLARLIEQTWSGKIDPKVANALTYQISTAAKIISDEAQLELAKRIASLEDRVGIKPKPQGRHLNG